jgi:hypothetical protein
MQMTGASGALSPRFSLPADGCEAGRSDPALTAFGTVVIYGFADAVAALSAADGLGVPVHLEVPFTVAGSLGPAVAREIIEQAQSAVPGCRCSWVIDCGDEPGTALAAIKAGAPEVRIAVDAELRVRIADIARQSRAKLEEHPLPGPRLDLAEVADAPKACRTWLQTWFRHAEWAAKGALPSKIGSCI